MKKLKAEQKRKIAAVIAIVLIVAMVLSVAVPMFWATANAAESSEYTIEANIGFGGNAKINSRIPVTVTVTNNSNKNFKGEIAVLELQSSASYIGNTDSTYTKYSEQTEIAVGGTHTANFNISVNTIISSVKIRLENKNKVIAEQEVPIQVRSGEDCLVGIISDNPERLTYLNPAYYSSNKGVTADITSVSDSAASDLDCINTFIINDYDLAALSGEKVDAIMSAVKNGSTVVLGMGSRLGSVDKLPLDENSAYAIGDGDLCKIYEVGCGKVFKLNADLSDTNAANGSDVAYLINYAFSNYVDYVGDKSIKNNLIGYTDRLPNFTDRTIDIIKVIIVIYIIFIPVLYLKLKKKDRREDAIKIIPMAALGVSFIIYLISFNTVYKKPIGTQINYISTSDKDGGSVSCISYENIVSPSKGDLKITTDADREILSVSDKNYNYGEAYAVNSARNSGDDYKVTKEIIKSDSGCIIQQDKKAKWGSTYITSKKNVEIGGSFDINADINSGYMLGGSVVNNTGQDFNEVIVIARSYDGLLGLKRFEDIKNGGTIELSALNAELYPSTYPDMYTFRSEVNPYTNTFDRTDKTLKQRYRYEMEWDIIDQLGSNSGSTNQGITVYVVGFNDKVLGEDNTRVNGKKVSKSVLNMFVNEVSVGNTDSYSLSGLSGNDGSSEQDLFALDFRVETPYNAVLNGDKLTITDTYDYVELSFLPSTADSFIIAWNDDIDETLILNNSTGWWDDLSNGEYCATADYISQDGRIHIKATGFQSNVTYLPSIISASSEYQGGSANA